MTEESEIKGIEEWSVKEIAERTEEKTNGKRLFLPPIQRSIVWDNAQIINYWDSLLRGYPPGVMMYYRVQDGSKDDTKAVNADSGETVDNLRGDDYQLFDGQQRLSAILLGMGKGPLAKDHRLWIDFGSDPAPESGLRFQLRMTTMGQPFGYDPKHPSQKLEFSKRRNQWKEWRNKEGNNNEDHCKYEYVFKEARGEDIIDAKCAIPFEHIRDPEHIIENIDDYMRNHAKKEYKEDTVEKFKEALKCALESKIILHPVPEKIVNHHDEYVRFFERVGQGGTRLSNDELTYSLIKKQYPDIRERMNKIMGNVGRLNSEVDLALASVRVSKVCHPWLDAKNGEVVERPQPSFIKKLKDDDKSNLQKEFKKLVLGKEENRLEKILKGIRDALVYHEKDHREGLPTILLSNLNKHLVDVLLLFAIKKGDDQDWKTKERDLLTSFVLYWLFFVDNDEKAARRIFETVYASSSHEAKQPWSFTCESLKSLIQTLKDDGCSWRLFQNEEIKQIRNNLNKTKAQSNLRHWNERFKPAPNTENDNNLRILATNRDRIKRVLLWLQRSYIDRNSQGYDPTSGRDEDLPFDLDHIIPQAKFGFDWREKETRLATDMINDNFRYQRGEIGNSLGNFRWLNASDNRSRQNGEYKGVDDEGGDGDLGCIAGITDEDWNRLIKEQPWNEEDVANFQYWIDLRTLELYKKLITDSKIVEYFPEASSLSTL